MLIFLYTNFDLPANRTNISGKLQHMIMFSIRFDLHESLKKCA